MRIYVAIPENKNCQSKGVLEFTDTSKLKELNDAGYGIFQTVNVMQENRRGNNFVKELNYIYCDFDLKKEGEKKDISELKIKVIKDLKEHCEPTFTVETKNGLHPYWELEDKNIKNAELYKKILLGVIDFSILLGSAGDKVKDLARILRAPGYFHLKGDDKFMCNLTRGSMKKFSYEELLKKFPYTETSSTQKSMPLNSFSNGIDNIDIKDIYVAVMAEIGQRIEFDSIGRVINQDGKRGVFVGRDGDGQYIANGGSSKLPQKGNRITIVASTLGINNKEAYKWICNRFNIQTKKEVETQEIVEKVKNEKPAEVDITKKEKRFTWGTRQLDVNFAIIKPSNFIVIGASRGSGKTTFSFDMAIKNARLGHKTIYMSLEMNENEILDDFARKYSGITIEEEYDFNVPNRKKNAYDKRISELKSVEKLTFKGLRDVKNKTWSVLEAIIRDEIGTDIVFIDNLDLITGESNHSDIDRQKKIVEGILSFTSSTGIPVVLIHHYRKKSANKDYGMDELSGSGKIADGADRIVKVARNQEEDATGIDRFRTYLYLQKGRGYPECGLNVFFVKGSFTDVDGDGFYEF